jgi:hypothetical protein
MQSLDTEFGAVLQAMVTTTPGALGAVLSDDHGDAIDFAYDRTRLTAVDVQLLGAQLGQTLFKLEPTYARHALPGAAVLVESEAHSLLASALAGQYVMAMLLEHRSNVAAAFAAFATARDELTALL